MASDPVPLLQSLIPCRSVTPDEGGAPARSVIGALSEATVSPSGSTMRVATSRVLRLTVSLATCVTISTTATSSSTSGVVTRTSPAEK